MNARATQVAAGFVLRGGPLAWRGRKRKGGARSPCGKLIPVREAEAPNGVQSRRLAAVEIAGAERDQKSSYPLGVIRLRRLITEDEHLAGLEFAARWTAAERPRSPPSCLGSADRIKGQANDGPSGAAENRYLAARAALNSVGARAIHLVRDIVLFEHWPRFLDTERRRPPAAWQADARDLAALRAGLRVLAREFGMRSHRDDAVAEIEESVASFRLRRAARLAAAD